MGSRSGRKPGGDGESLYANPAAAKLIVAGQFLRFVSNRLAVSVDFTDSQLESYLDESLDPNTAAQLEQACREDAALVNRLASINRRRDAGIHTLGEIWRRHQLGVPSAEDVSDFLAGKLSPGQSDYLRFRLDVLKCRFTTALVEAAEQQSADSGERSKARREKYFHKSADLLPKSSQ